MLRRIRFGRRHSANWVLLRAVCRSHSDRPLAIARARLDARAALARYMRLGFIADRAGVRSFAYHCFCGALLVDLWQRRGYRWAAAAAAQAAEFISRFILPNGDALYVGRGQEQIFGYGALLYLLEAAGEMTGNADFREYADRVFGYLLSFQRNDGAFPLVLREGEDPEPWTDGTRLGWYSYNRYADYLPFLGCMLLKAARPTARRPRRRSILTSACTARRGMSLSSRVQAVRLRTTWHSHMCASTRSRSSRATGRREDPRLTPCRCRTGRSQAGGNTHFVSECGID
jgi:hypothetical protein